MLNPVRSLRSALGTILVAVAAASASPAVGQVSLTGGAATENFDGLSSVVASGVAWTDNTTIAGAYSTRTTYNVATGSSNAGALYSFGVAGTNPVTERALGGIGSGGTGTFYWAMRYVNNTGAPVTSLLVSYNGEQWRDGGNATPVAQQIDFQYQVATAGTITDADTPNTGWIDENPLDFVSPVFTTTAGALDGNAPANRTAIASTIVFGSAVAIGEEIWIRWRDINDGGNDHGLAIDDLSVTPSGGGGGTNLSINDVTMAEGDPPGTTTFTFAVTLSAAAGAGGVTFDIATADGTAQDGDMGGEDTDYVAQSLTGQSIPMGSTGPFNFDVTVSRDTAVEPNETFFVNVTNVTGATVTDGQGQGTINNDDVAITPIHDIQGPGASSPIVGASVTTRGIVTGVRSNGFYIQEPDATVDADPATSEGIFVFTNAAPPPAAVVAAQVQVAGTVAEFVPSADPLQPPLTELTTPTVVQLSTGNPLPAPIPLTSTFPDPAGPHDQLERVEGMRVSVASLTVTGPTLGNVNETTATATSNGVFYGVVTGVARPFREAGIPAPDPAPAGSGVTIPPVPRFDSNPERIRVDSDALGGALVDVATDAIVTGLVGPLDYTFRTYTILPDAGAVLGVAGGATPAAATAPATDEITVAAFNLERFFDDVNDPMIGEPVLTAMAYQNRLDKASLAIRNFLHFPDILGVIEVEDLFTLQDLAAAISADAVTAAQPDPMYTAFLVEGNDPGGIDVGFLIKTAEVSVGTARVDVNSVMQLGAMTTYFDICAGMNDLLNDRPPLLLDATVNYSNGNSFDLSVVVVHQRSLNGVNDDTVCTGGTQGERVRLKRQAQAAFLANEIDLLQATENVVVLGDFNAFEVNDGLADTMGTTVGAPSPDNETAVAGDGADLVDPNFQLLLASAPAERYSFVFDGNAQSLDHVLISNGLATHPDVVSFRMEHPRIDADFPETARNNAAVPTRISDHDPVMLYLEIGTFPVELLHFEVE